MQLDEALCWLEREVHRNDVVVIDPVTILTPRQGKLNEAQHHFMTEARGLIDKSRSRLILVTHPVEDKTKPMATSSAEAGSASFKRLSDSVFWLTRVPQKDIQGGSQTYQWNNEIISGKYEKGH